MRMQTANKISITVDVFAGSSGRGSTCISADAFRKALEKGVEAATEQAVEAAKAQSTDERPCDVSVKIHISFGSSGDAHFSMR